MLKLLNDTDIETVRYLSADSILGTRIYCLAICYGFNSGFLDFWAGEGALICRFDNTFTVVTKNNTDFNELREFLEIIGADDIVCTKDTAKKLDFVNFSVKSAFVYKGDECISDCAQSLNDENIKDLYSLISNAIPGSFINDKNSYLSFLSDYKFRKNRGFARSMGVIVDGELVSTAITASETESAAIISGVACKEEYRKFGYGKKTVITLTESLKAEDKNVYVIALNDSAIGFYEHIGFKKIDEIAYITKKV